MPYVQMIIHTYCLPQFAKVGTMLACQVVVDGQPLIGVGLPPFLPAVYDQFSCTCQQTKQQKVPHRSPLDMSCIDAGCLDPCSIGSIRKPLWR